MYRALHLSYGVFSIDETNGQMDGGRTRGRNRTPKESTFGQPSGVSAFFVYDMYSHFTHTQREFVYGHVDPFILYKTKHKIENWIPGSVLAPWRWLAVGESNRAIRPIPKWMLLFI